MSIYPVPLQKWFPNPRRVNREYTRNDMYSYEICRTLVKLMKCHKCGKHCKWNRAWGHHAVPYGYGDIWCSEKCLYGE